MILLQIMIPMYTLACMYIVRIYFKCEKVSEIGEKAT